MKKFNKTIDEVRQEIFEKLTGTGLKELTIEQEDALRQVFFASEEYQKGYVRDFEDWLKAYGYKKNGFK